MHVTKRWRGPKQRAGSMPAGHAKWACRLVWNTPAAWDHAGASWCACTPPRGFVVRSSADFGVPITTSLCVQVPRDTGSSVSVVIFGLRHVIFGLRAVLGQLMYLRRPNTEIHLSFGLAARVCLVLSRCSPSPHRTAGGPRKLVLGMASAMGNNRGVFIPPSFPSLGPHRNLY